MKTRSKRGAVVLVAATATALTLSGGIGAYAAPKATKARTTAAAVAGPAQAGAERKGFYDSRTGNTKVLTKRAAAVVGARGKAYTKFSKSLKREGSISIDPLTGTPRQVAKLNGYLTKKASGSARSIALNYVAQHHSVFGLTRADLASFTVSNDYVDVLGTHHVSWQQHVRGIPVFSNGLKANVTKNGRVISIQGSPIAHIAIASDGRSTSPALSAAAARSAAVSDVGGRVATATHTRRGARSTWSNGDTATLMWFQTASGLKLAWLTYTSSGPSLGYQHVIGAKSGTVLYRRSTVDYEKGDAEVYDYHPGTGPGGGSKVVNLVKRGYVAADAHWLTGAYADAWADLNDNNLPDANEITPVPGTATGAQFPLATFPKSSGLCSAVFVCTWNPNTPYSWAANKKEDVTNAFYLASNFHDYLKAGPIGFTRQAGNFETAGGDPVLVQALDGANTAGGLPDGNHIDNANMDTPPDGTSPTMQMYLWHFPGATDAQDGYVPTSGAFDASVLYHEYTHGLSNRLVVDSDGISTLNGVQAGSMGEAWSDYYALDYLVTKGLQPDTAKDGEVSEGSYLTAGAPFRTEPIDCKVGSKAARCVDVFGGQGGYTYGDFPDISGSGPEVHASGEVWSQTLWDLRTKFGHTKADMLITRAMELAPAEPTMLDMRNAVLQADQVAYSGRDQHGIWQVFANRGMGWYAGATDTGDANPAEDFHLPPVAGTPRATLSGLVTDPITHRPVADALVSITGHDSGFIGDYTGVSNSRGRYSIPRVLIGTYKKVLVSAPGHELAVQAVNVRAPSTTKGFAVRADYAAASGGGSITAYNGPDYSPACGPVGAIDLSQGTGWGSTTGDDNGTPTNHFIPKYIVVKLSKSTNITSFAVDPSATCGDAGSASTGQYRIDTSANGTSWTTAAAGTFDSTNRGQYNELVPTAGTTGVRYVRFTILGNQVPDFATNCPDGAYSGCSFTDMTELEVFGS